MSAKGVRGLSEPGTSAGGSWRGALILDSLKHTIDNIVVDDRIPEGIPKPLAHTEPGMLMTKSKTGTQQVAPDWAVHIFVKLTVEITLHALLFQPTYRAARFPTSLHQ